MSLKPVQHQGAVMLFDRQMNSLYEYDCARASYTRAGQITILRYYEYGEQHVELEVATVSMNGLTMLEWRHEELKFLMKAHHGDLHRPGFDPDQIEDPYVRYGLKFAIKRELDA